jgi:hypothetical protein
MGEFLQRICYYVPAETVVVLPLYIKKIEIFIPCRCLEIFPRTKTTTTLTANQNYINMTKYSTPRKTTSKNNLGVNAPRKASSRRTTSNFRRRLVLPNTTEQVPPTTPTNEASCPNRSLGECSSQRTA